MNLLEEIIRLRKLIGTRCPLGQSEAYMLCDALENSIGILEYYSHPDHYEQSATLGGTGFRKPGVLIGER